MLDKEKDKIRRYRAKRAEKNKGKIEQKKRASGKFGQTKLKQSQKGILSCRIAVTVTVMVVLLFVCAFAMHGKAAPIIGSLGIMAMIFSWIGIVQGIHGLREREKDYRTCKIGIVYNAGVIFFLLIIFFRGFL